MRAGAPRVVLGTTAVDPGAKTQIFGGGEGLKFSRATPAYTGLVNDEEAVRWENAPQATTPLSSHAVTAAVSSSPADR